MDSQRNDAHTLGTDPGHRYQVMPPLAPEELAQLEASIRERGVEDPVEVDEEGNVLDGHHRRAIANRLGVPCPTRVVTGLTEDEKRLHAVRRNTERRQLSRAQRALLGMKAEPLYRDQAKARQGARTDLQPDLAKGRRVWAGEEAARLVGLPLSTYKRYREIIHRACALHGAERVEQAIETAEWDVAELRAAVNMEAGLKLHWDQGGSSRWSPGVETEPEDALWACPQCESVSSSITTSCTRCGCRKPGPNHYTISNYHPEPLSVQIDPVASPNPPLSDPAANEKAREDAAKKGLPYRPDLPRDIRLPSGRTWWLQLILQSHLKWSTRDDARELAAQVVRQWQPRRVADLREGIRLLSGWLAAFDAALGDASVGLRTAEPVQQEEPDDA